MSFQMMLVENAFSGVRQSAGGKTKGEDAERGSSFEVAIAQALQSAFLGVMQEQPPTQPVALGDEGSGQKEIAQNGGTEVIAGAANLETKWLTSRQEIGAGPAGAGNITAKAGGNQYAIPIETSNSQATAREVEMAFSGVLRATVGHAGSVSVTPTQEIGLAPSYDPFSVPVQVDLEVLRRLQTELGADKLSPGQTPMLSVVESQAASSAGDLAAILATEIGELKDRPITSPKSAADGPGSVEVAIASESNAGPSESAGSVPSQVDTSTSLQSWQHRAETGTAGVSEDAKGKVPSLIVEASEHEEENTESAKGVASRDGVDGLQAASQVRTIENSPVTEGLPELNAGADPSEKARAVAETLYQEAVKKLPRSVEIHMDPPSMGSVTALLTQRGQDVTVKFVAHSQEAHNMLSEATPDLARALSDKGLVLFGLSVDLGQGGQSGEGRAAKDEKPASRFGRGTRLRAVQTDATAQRSGGQVGSFTWLA